MTSVSVWLRKRKPSLLELPFEEVVVLDDAVVDDGDRAVAAQVGMGIDIGGTAVRGPARVADAGKPWGRLPLQQRFEVGNTTGTLAQPQVGPGDGCHAGAVVAAVFEAGQALQKDRRSFTLSRVTDDSTHMRSSWVGCAGPPGGKRESFLFLGYISRGSADARNKRARRLPNSGKDAIPAVEPRFGKSGAETIGMSRQLPE